jgi:hypothetical protein
MCLPGDFCQPFAIAIEQGQRGTFRREQICSSAPDPRRGAGDQDPSASKATGRCG